jgi:rod shape-determining protein MreC
MAWRRTRVVLGALVAVAVALILIDVRGHGPADALRGAAGVIAGPPERAVAWVRTQATDRFGGTAADRARIAELEAELDRARALAAAAAAGELSAAELRELAALVPAAGWTQVPARVVSVTAAQDGVRSAAISVGSGAQVLPGLAVLAGSGASGGSGGLAGLVDVVAPLVSTVRLVVDPTVEMAARVASSGEVGVYRGTGDGGRFELLDPLGEVAAGDLIVTLGVPGGTVPADLPIGRVAQVTGSSAALDRVAEVTPAVDDSTMDRVVVLIPGAGEAGGS